MNQYSRLTRIARLMPARKKPLGRLNHCAMNLVTLEDKITPATILVTGNGDSIAPDGKVTLREAVESINKASNVNADVVAIGPYGSADSIGFSGIFSSPQTILLGSSLPNLVKALVLDGPTAELTISGQNNVRIWSINVAVANSIVNISDVTLANGKSSATGGALAITDEVVTLANVKVLNNTAVTDGGGIAVVGGTLNISSSVVSGNKATKNGGGIHIASGKLNISNSEISGNNAYFIGGGGILMSSTDAAIDKSSISGNHADTKGGSGFYCGYGGGILLQDNLNQLNVTNSTISGNTATGATPSSVGGYGGGIGVYYLSQNGTIFLTNSTVSGNSANKGTSTKGGRGGGIGIGLGATLSVNINSSTIAYNSASGSGGNIFAQYVGTAFNLYNALVANGTAPDAPDIINAQAMNATYSLFGNTSKTLITPHASNSLNVDPMLDPVLAFNHGGTTKTHALKAGSPAIDAGDNTGKLYASDQTGTVSRTYDGAAVNKGDGTDVGALEAQLPSVSSIVWQNGENQRSIVTTVKVTFVYESTMSFSPGLFSLERYKNGTGTVNLSPTQNGSEFVITFAAGGTADIDPITKSLQDGTYRLTIDASKVVGATGAMAANVESKTHRLFGDTRGIAPNSPADGNVTSEDFGDFRRVFGTAASPGSLAFAFDFNGNGTVDSGDFAEFRKRFGLNNFAP